MAETRRAAVAPMLEERCELTRGHRELQHCVTGRTDGTAWAFRWVNVPARVDTPSAGVDGAVAR
jgi:hypothetical protein